MFKSLKRWLCRHGFHAWELFARGWNPPQERCSWCHEVRNL